VATKPLNVLLFGIFIVILAVAAMILMISNHWNASDAWLSSSVGLTALIALLGFAGVGVVSSGVVSLLSNPRAKNQTGLDLRLSMISLLPSILPKFLHQAPSCKNS
jgi:hypothetical protein